MHCGEYALQDVLIKEFRASELPREAAWRGESRKYPNEAQGGLREAAGRPGRPDRVQMAQMCVFPRE